MSKQVVHTLLHGLPLCGFTTLPPNDWPAGHYWLCVGDKVPKHRAGTMIRCLVCRKREAPLVRKKKSQ
jgi:hypothetical protein